MANGTRFSAVEGQDIDLNIIIEERDTTTGITTPYDPYEFTKVEIYASKDDADNDANSLYTITTASIVKVTTGNYKVTVPSSLGLQFGTYFDKAYVVPTLGASTITSVHVFYIGRETIEIPPSDHQRARIYGNIYDIVDDPQSNEQICINMNVEYAFYGNEIIKREQIKFKTDVNGYFEFDLLETDTLTQDTGKDVWYEVNIAGRYTDNVKVPKFSGLIHFRQLPRVY